ncbi:hypothetical protein H4582DRAFT_1118928 [Lactarius indigo]|nr:hypothetical protein H4582DRAFT_1118928 [Lactarius indigo]
MPRGCSAVRRISTFSAAQTRNMTTILLAGLLPGVKAEPDPWADCWIEFIHAGTGILHCNHLSAAARARIYLGLFVLFLVLFYFLALIFLLVTYRPRRVVRTNQQHQPNDDESTNTDEDGLPPYVHQYPPQAQGVPEDVPDCVCDPNEGAAPPTGSPPRYYPPPPSESPVEYHKGLHHV